jgi:hypothetical protein
MFPEGEGKTDTGTASNDAPKTDKAKGKSGKKANAKKASPKTDTKEKSPLKKGDDKAKGGSKKVAAKSDKKTTTKAVVEKDVFGFRKGSKKSQAAALYNSKKGATLAEVKEKTGSSQLNLLTELEGRVTIDTTKEKGAGKKQVTRYKITIPEGGVKAAKPAKKAEAKPAKAAAKPDKKADAKKTPAKADKTKTAKAAKPAKKAKAEAQANA